MDLNQSGCRDLAENFGSSSSDDSIVFVPETVSESNRATPSVFDIEHYPSPSKSAKRNRNVRVNSSKRA